MSLSAAIAKSTRAAAMMRSTTTNPMPQNSSAILQVHHRRTMVTVPSGVAAPRPAKVPGPETATSTPPTGGASLMERIGSFLVGAGLAGIVSQYYIYQELTTSNLRMIERQHDLEKRLRALEK